MKCTACGHSNRQNARFCGGCGATLEGPALCPGCGAENPPGQRFCDACGQPLAGAPAAARPTSGSVALPAPVGQGRYEVLRFLGEGTRKRVYLGRDTRLGREVAVAFVKTEGLDKTGLARVRREAEAMGRLGDHPNIVTIHDIGEEADGRLYIVSQYLAGGDLETLTQAAAEHRLSVPETIDIAAQIACALEHAHAHDIVHRDLKPTNVWLTADGVAKLGDFGLAVALDRSRLTLEGMMVGTVAYMSPEQGLGRPADARSDLYSLGALMYELLCGRPPFVGDDAVAIISQHVSTPPVGPSWHVAHVPRALEALILSLLEKSPQRRPQSAAEVREALAVMSAAAGSSEPAVREDPAALERLSRSMFIGREQETRQLRAATDEALAGRGRLIMVAGESGIGKTRLATELTTYAGLRGAQVLWGRCYEGEGAPAYWPWVQVIRSYVHERDATALSSEMGPGAADIAQIVSEVRDRLPGLPEPPTLEPEQARFRLFDSISTFLRNAAAGHPLVIVLDDLHSADKPSLLLLQFLARELREARIFVLGTYRDVELDRHHPLSEVLATLRREQGYDRVLLRGLSVDEVKGMLEAAAQHPLESTDELALVDAIHRETEGNPYFVEEVVRHLVESGGVYQRDGRWVSNARRIEELGIPEGVRDVIGRRLARLSDDCNRLLTIASVIGREFRLETLEHVSGDPQDLLLERLEEAVRAGILSEEPELGRYSFSAAIIRETLYGDLTTSRRLALHRRIAEVLEDAYSSDVDAHLGELAHHFLEAAQAGDVGKAVDYARRAGDRAARLLAYEEAAGHYERALQALEVKPPNGGNGTAELLLALGDARWRAGDTERAKETFNQAARLARQHADADVYARAALGYGVGIGGFGVADRADETLLDLLNDALEALPDEDAALRVEVMARLAVELYYTDAVAERDLLSSEAVAMAQRLDDPPVLLRALYSRHWSMLGTDSPEEQLRAATEIVRLARLVGDREMEFRGHHFRLNCLLQLGDMASVDAEIRNCTRLAKELRQPLYLWQSTVFQAMRALAAGRFEEGERLAGQAARIGQRGHKDITQVTAAGQIFITSWGQGRLGDIVDGVRAFVDEYPQSTWPAALAFAFAELDRRAEARSTVEGFGRDFDALRRDGNWLATLTCLTWAVTYLGDAGRAATLYDLLLPYRDQWASLNAGILLLPPIDAPLGCLAATMGRSPDAIEHFERALERMAVAGERCWSPLVRREYARALLSRGRPLDRARAIEVLDGALDQARGAGMPRLTEQLLALKLDAQGISSIGVRSSIDAVAESVHASRPDVRPAAAPDGTVTVMFSDIEDSTAINERLGDEGWLAILREHNATIRRKVMEHGGFEVKSQGDGFMLAFADPQRALACAVDLQRTFASRRASPSGSKEPIHIRVGLHTGEAIRHQDDFFGKNVVLASRIAERARGDEILISETLKEALHPAAEQFTFDEGQELELKGLTGRHRVFAVPWQEADVGARG